MARMTRMKKEDLYEGFELALMEAYQAGTLA